MRFLDSLSNFISGLGTRADKARGARYVFNLLTADQLEAAYRGDWVARKAINIPADDATREWRSWKAEAKQITAIEEEERRLGVQHKVRSAMRKARLFGGAAVYIVVDTQDQASPLDINRIGKQGVDFLNVLLRHELNAGPVVDDPLRAEYGQPEYYELNSPSRGLVRVHPTRLIRFNGLELPDQSKSSDGWGDSVLQAVDDAIKAFATVSQSAATLVNEACISVVKVPGMLERMGEPEYRAKLLKRYQLAMIGKSNINTLMLDAEEDYSRDTYTFAGLEPLIRTYMQIVAAAADVPVARMLGAAPGSLNATGEGDIRNYYDSVSSVQRNELGPSLVSLDEALLRSALGTRPEDVYYTWNSLWQQSASERADISTKDVASVKILHDTGLIRDDKLSKAVVNMVIENGLLPGLDEDSFVDIAEPEEDNPDEAGLTLNPADNPEGAVKPPGTTNKPPTEPGTEEEEV